MDKIFAEIEKGEPVTDERDESRCIASAPSRFIRLRCDNKSNVQESNNFRCAEIKKLFCNVLVNNKTSSQLPSADDARENFPPEKPNGIHLSTDCVLVKFRLNYRICCKF